MDASLISRHIKEAPKTPGVYIWRGKRGLPLYIGKAANLRSRLSNYLSPADPRIQLMVKTAVSLTWHKTGTDIEALILESNLIKTRRPRFNITMRDDKQYFYVGFTKETFPRIFLSHQPDEDGDFIGPFTEGVPLKSTLRSLRRLFPYCTCKGRHNLRCLNAHIGKCPGYCCLKAQATAAQKKEYDRHTKAIRDILSGKRANVIRSFEKEMVRAGQQHKLEEALRLQHQLASLRRVFENAQINATNQRLSARHHSGLAQLVSEFGLPVSPERIEGYDIANIQGNSASGSMVVFTGGKADTGEYRLFNVQAGGGDTAMLREMLSRRFKHSEWTWPDLVVVDGGKAQLNAVLAVLTEHNLNIPVIALTKNERHQGDHVFSSLDKRVRYLKDLPRHLAELILHIDSEAHRFSIKQYRRRHRSLLVE